MTSGTPSTVPPFVRGDLPQLRLGGDSPAKASDRAGGGDTVLVVPVVLGPSGPSVPVAGPLGEAVQTALWKTVVRAGVTGRAGATSVASVLPADEGVPAGRVLAVGLGPVELLTPDVLRAAAGDASRVLEGIAGRPDSADIHALSLLADLTSLDDCPLSPAQVTGAAVEGHALGGYRYPGMRRPTGAGHLATVTVLAPDLPEMPEVFARACTVVESVACARDLVNAPASVLYPDSYAQIIAELGDRSGVEVTVLDEEELAAAGFGGITGVGRGSTRPPRLVRMHYRPEEASGHVALVGKGVTFDTGGVSLKKPARMDDMISDMGGSAAVVATVLAAAELELAVEVTATLPLAENMPDGDALRPGDILRHYDGTTTEILNTDAEGRLLLADAVARAVEDGPDLLVETATLTGAQVTALGDRITAVMGTPALRDTVVALGRRAGEDAWPMPLPDEIAADIRSDVADIRNTGSVRWGGMAAAGQYLAHFVPEGLPWCHLDIAGPAYNTGAARGYTPKRGTGAPVRTLVALLEDVAARR